jgi:hypothetical protein
MASHTKSSGFEVQYAGLLDKVIYIYQIRVFGKLRERQGIWGYFGGSTTKIPPKLPFTPVIPREPQIMR